MVGCHRTILNIDTAGAQTATPELPGYTVPTQGSMPMCTFTPVPTYESLIPKITIPSISLPTLGPSPTIDPHETVMPKTETPTPTVTPSPTLSATPGPGYWVENFTDVSVTVTSDSCSFISGQFLHSYLVPNNNEVRAVIVGITQGGTAGGGSIGTDSLGSDIWSSTANNGIYCFYRTGYQSACNYGQWWTTYGAASWRSMSGWQGIHLI